MSEWDRFLTDTDKAVAEAAGYGAAGDHPARPALLVIDVTRDFCGPEGLDRVAAARHTRTACGPPAWAAVPHIARLIGVARAAHHPVIYTHRSAGRLAMRRTKTARAGEDGAEGNAIVAPIAPQDGDHVIGKDRPSAFWQTGLADRLHDLGCDGVVLTGGTTSGCVRATATDAFNLGLACVIVRDAVFDRFDASHALSLFDLGAKYADLVTTAEVEGWLAQDHHPRMPLGSNTNPR